MQPTTSMRLSLFAAVAVPPILVTLMNGFLPERWLAGLIWSVLGSVAVVGLPRRWLQVVVFALVILLPINLHWLGYATLHGTGPHIDALVAASRSDWAEIFAAARLVLTSASFVAAASIHLICLGVAVRSGLRRWPPDRGLPALLLASTLAFATAAAAQTSGLAHRWLVDADMFASPLLTLAGNAESLIAHAVNEGPKTEVRAADVRSLAKTARPAQTVVAIFFIGESVRHDYLGHARRGRGPWTGALDDRIASGLGRWLPPTCAGSNGTHVSVPLLVTGTRPSEHAVASAGGMPSGLGRLHAAGFRTAWISTQQRNIYDEPGHDLVIFHDHESRANSGMGRFDEVLADSLDVFLAPLRSGSLPGPTAAVLHGQGSHFQYLDRYPGSFFGPEPAGLGADELSDLRYDRSVEYGAFVLNRIAMQLDDLPVPAFLIYTSDHGQNLHADRNGLLTHLGPRNSRPDSLVPAIVLWNREMQARHNPAQVLARLEAAELLAHADIYRLWMGMSGIDDNAAPLEAESEPMTWGRLRAAERRPRVVPCRALLP